MTTRRLRVMLTAVSASGDQRIGTAFEIWVVGELGDTVAGELGATSIEVDDGRTRIVVEVIDQAHLHGILERLRDFNVDIERVNPV